MQDNGESKWTPALSQQRGEQSALWLLGIASGMEGATLLESLFMYFNVFNYRLQ